jgi:hypothetical protein
VKGCVRFGSWCMHRGGEEVCEEGAGNPAYDLAYAVWVGAAGPEVFRSCGH